MTQARRKAHGAGAAFPNRYRLVKGKAGVADLALARLAKAAPSTVRVIVQVLQQDYIPAGVQVSRRIGPKMFTAEVRTDQLELVRADPLVKRMSPGEPVHLIG